MGGTEKESKVLDLKPSCEKDIASVKAEIQKTVEKLVAETEKYGKTKVANAKLNVAGKAAEGKKAIAESEGDATYGFQARRQQDTELLRLDILENLAKNSKINIATSTENNMGLAQDNSLVTQAAHQGLEALRSKLAEMTNSSITKLEFGKKISGGLVRPTLQQMH